MSEITIKISNGKLYVKVDEKPISAIYDLSLQSNYKDNPINPSLHISFPDVDFARENAKLIKQAYPNCHISFLSV